MLDQKETVSACDTDRPEQTPLTAPIVADMAAARKSFKTMQARAALAGHTLTQVSTGFMLSRWSQSKHCPDLATVEVLLDRMGAKS